MWNRFRQTFHGLMRRFYAQSPQKKAQPLNKFSLGIIIVIDLFILWQVFGGLSEISAWPLSPSQAYPCYAAWSEYRTPPQGENITGETRNIAKIRQAIVDPSLNFNETLQDSYRRNAENHLGQLSPVCGQYATSQDAINTPANLATLKKIEAQERGIADLEAANQKIRQEYDSTLLEQIAGQPQSESINTVAAAQARQTIAANNQKISNLNQEKQTLLNTLLNQPQSRAFLTLLNNESLFKEVETGYFGARFWHPTQQLILQVLFLAPLIVIASIVHRWAWQRNFGLLALLSWHLLVIFLIPLVFKIFEVLQFGAIFSFLLGIVTALFGQLLFLVNYVYILLIPLLGFGLIKFGQRVLFNPPSQASNRLQKSRCMQCGCKIRISDHYCPHCGFDQYHACPNCQQSTYIYLPYCKECGAEQSPN